MAFSHQGATEVTQIDALAATVRVTAITQQADLHVLHHPARVFPARFVCVLHQLKHIIDALNGSLLSHW